MPDEIIINREHEQAILEAIKEFSIYRFADIFNKYKGCVRSTAYLHNLDKSDNIKEALLLNRRTAVTSLLSKWLDSENPTLQLAAMKLLCEIEEHKRLQQNYTDHTTDGEKIVYPPIIVDSKQHADMIENLSDD